MERGMSLQELQDLAKVRIAEAGSLLSGGFYDGAYYLAGYAVELALKACVAKLIVAQEYPPSSDYSKKLFTHSIESLVTLAELTDARNAEKVADPAFSTNWNVVIAWNEETRYKRWTKVQAEDMYNAVADPANGVLRWLKGCW